MSIAEQLNIEPESFAQKVRTVRLLRGLRQVDVSQAIGLRSSATVSRWEKGDYYPDALELVRLAAILRVDVSYLLDGLEAIAVESDSGRCETRRLHLVTESGNGVPIVVDLVAPTLTVVQ